jgi:thiol:disulfide interchange protein DsbC
MQADGCGAEDCRSCHSLSKDEARGLLKELRLKVLDVAFSEVPGLWVVDVQNPQGRRGPVYVDFSKQHLIKGTILKLATKENLTQQRLIERNRIDPSIIPLDDALVIGNPKAQNRIVVFDDPQCKFCRKLHPELKRLTETRDDVAFYVQMFPLKGNPTSYDKAKAIICAKSLQMLEASLAGKKLPSPECDTDAVDRNLEIGRLIGVRSTPTLVFPDGRVVPGYKTAEKIAEFLGE